MNIGSGGIDPPREASPKFIESLNREVKDWVRQGFIDADQASRIKAYYRSGGPQLSPSAMAMRLIMVLGGLMIGIGVISFVAYNWQYFTFATKAILLNLTILAVYAVGIHLFLGQRYQQLGHALIFVGCILFGADLGLMSQGTNTGTGASHGYGVWAAGVFAVALATQSLPIAALSSFAATVWAFQGVQEPAGTLPELRFLLPALAFLAFGAAHRSKPLAAFAAVSFGGGLGWHLVRPFPDHWPLAVISVAFLYLVVAFASLRTRFGATVAEPLAGIGATALVVGSYVSTFHTVWEGKPPLAVQNDSPSPYVAYLLLVVAALAALLMADRRRLLEWLRTPALWIVVAGAGILKLATLLHSFVADTVLLTTLANLGAIAFGAALVVDSIQRERRESFWAGSLFLGGLVLARLFEYESGLHIKALAFIACGVALLVAGTLFERSLNKKEDHHVPSVHA
ncbi:MAG TPA: DUF2157 domain-containing protein [Fimbriimonas sp.]